MVIQNTMATLKRPSAFNRMRQRRERRKKEKEVAQSAGAMYRKAAAAMVRHTFLQSTPRTAKYSSTAARAIARSQDHRRPRVPPWEKISAWAAAGTASIITLAAELTRANQRPNQSPL